jgi:hypothetical protein
MSRPSCVPTQSNVAAPKAPSEAELSRERAKNVFTSTVPSPHAVEAELTRRQQLSSRISRLAALEQTLASREQDKEPLFEAFDELLRTGEPQTGDESEQMLLDAAAAATQFAAAHNATTRMLEPDRVAAELRTISALQTRVNVKLVGSSGSSWRDRHEKFFAGVLAGEKAVSKTEARTLHVTARSEKVFYPEQLVFADSIRPLAATLGRGEVCLGLQLSSMKHVALRAVGRELERLLTEFDRAADALDHTSDTRRQYLKVLRIAQRLCCDEITHFLPRAES